MKDLDNIKYQLQSLSMYEPSDIEDPEFDVAYEDGNGMEGFVTVCCVDLAGKALLAIEALGSQLKSKEKTK